MTKKVALITGIAGQDGSYLAEFLLEKDYEVWGMILQNESLDNLSDIKSNLKLRKGDLVDYESIKSILSESRPEEIYNFAAQSSVKISEEEPELTNNINHEGVKRLFQAINELKLNPKFFQASSSELFGNSKTEKINESSTFSPKNPYAKSKLDAYRFLVEKRKEGLFCCSGFFFNHESPRRPEKFVTKRIIKGLVKIKIGIQDKLDLGNINIKKDWGYAKDYVEAMWLMLQQPYPQDYIIGSGNLHSIREFIMQTASTLNLNIKSNNLQNTEEKFIDESGKVVIEINPNFFRKTEPNNIFADITEIKKDLNWEPKTSFEELIKIMVDHDLEIESKNQLKGDLFPIINFSNSGSM